MCGGIGDGGFCIICLFLAPVFRSAVLLLFSEEKGMEIEDLVTDMPPSSSFSYCCDVNDWNAVLSRTCIYPCITGNFWMALHIIKPQSHSSGFSLSLSFSFSWSLMIMILLTFPLRRITHKNVMRSCRECGCRRLWTFR